MTDDAIDAADALNSQVAMALGILHSMVGCGGLFAPNLEPTRRGLWLAIRECLANTRDDAARFGVLDERDALFSLANHAAAHWEHFDGIGTEHLHNYAWAGRLLAERLKALAEENFGRMMSKKEIV